MVKLNKLLYLFILLSVAGISQAQDIHFSQFNQAPLALNPALTGNYACDWRAGLNYRNQWKSVTTPYKTYSAYFDMPIVKGIAGTDRLAAGLLLFNDVSGDANYSQLSALASLAYHKSLGSGNHTLSGGLQVGILQKSIDWEKLQWASQFDGNDFNSSLPSYENNSANNFTNLDLNFGIVYKGKFNDNFTLELGGAGNHLVPPHESFEGNTDNTLSTRITAHARAIATLNTNWGLIPSVLYMTQAGAQEIVAGTDIGYFINNANFPATIFLSGYYRVQDAVIAGVGIDYKNFRFGVTYDINTSSLKDASGGKGGLELSLNYTGCILPVIPKNYILPCPRY